MKKFSAVLLYICLVASLAFVLVGCGGQSAKEPSPLSLDKYRAMERTEVETALKDEFGFETKLLDNGGGIKTGGLQVSGDAVAEMINKLFGTDNPVKYTYVENDRANLYRVSFQFGKTDATGMRAKGQKPMMEKYNPDQLITDLESYCGFGDETKRGSINCGFEDGSYNIRRQKIRDEFVQGVVYSAGGNCRIGDKPGYWVIGVSTTTSTSMPDYYTNGAIEQVDIAVFEAKDSELDEFFDLLQKCSNQDYQDELKKTKNQALDMWSRMSFFANACNIWEDRF